MTETTWLGCLELTNRKWTKWGEAQNRAFETLESHIASPPILILPDFEKFVLQTDACNDGIGAILLPEESGIKHPVTFANRKLLPGESHYSKKQERIFSHFVGYIKFQNFLCGKTFILETDHQPLLYLGKAQYKNGCLMRWAEGRSLLCSSSSNFRPIPLRFLLRSSSTPLTCSSANVHYIWCYFIHR